jgi:hypothetical protein
MMLNRDLVRMRSTGRWILNQVSGQQPANVGDRRLACDSPNRVETAYRTMPMAGPLDELQRSQRARMCAILQSLPGRALNGGAWPGAETSTADRREPLSAVESARELFRAIDSPDFMRRYLDTLAKRS